MSNILDSLTKEEMLLKLIENDIYSGQLIYRLCDLMHLEASEYLLRLSDLVFHILGYDQDNIPHEVSDKYFDLIRRASLETVGTHWKQIPDRALSIYKEMHQYGMEE